MLSMTTHDITAFPERSSRVKRIADRLKEDPKDPLALGERGVLALDQGNLIAAIDDLRAALGGKLDTQQRLRFQQWLFDALTELLQRDYKGGEKFLADYRALARAEVPADLPEEDARRLKLDLKHRRSQSLMIHGSGQQALGKFADALEAYLDLAGQDTDETVPAPDDLALPGQPGCLGARSHPGFTGSQGRRGAPATRASDREALASRPGQNGHEPAARPCRNVGR